MSKDKFTMDDARFVLDEIKEFVDVNTATREDLEGAAKEAGGKILHFEKAVDESNEDYFNRVMDKLIDSVPEKWQKEILTCIHLEPDHAFSIFVPLCS
jgi:hypothetical protein